MKLRRIKLDSNRQTKTIRVGNPCEVDRNFCVRRNTLPLGLPGLI